MKIKKVMLGALGAFALMSLSNDGTAAQREWRVKRDALKCVVENIGAYLNRDTPVVIINMNDCPPSRKALPLPQAKSRSARDFDYAIVYPKRELQCLETYWNTKVGNEQIVILPSNLCQ